MQRDVAALVRYRDLEIDHAGNMRFVPRDVFVFIDFKKKNLIADLQLNLL